MPPGLFTSIIAKRDQALSAVREEIEELLGRSQPTGDGALAEEAPPEPEPEPEPEESSEDEEVKRQEADRARLLTEMQAREEQIALLSEGEATRSQRIEAMHQKLDELNAELAASKAAIAGLESAIEKL